MAKYLLGKLSILCFLWVNRHPTIMANTKKEILALMDKVSKLITSEEVQMNHKRIATNVLIRNVHSLNVRGIRLLSSKESEG